MRLNRWLTLASALLLAAAVAAGWRATRGPRPVALRPALTGKTEYCQTCHADLPEISAAHPSEAFGCVLCHGGERLALEAGLAHSTLRGGRNPSDLAVVEAACGGSDCHSGPASQARDHIHRVRTSVQSTYAGALATIRYAVGAQASLTAVVGIQAVEDPQITSASGQPRLAAFDPAADARPMISTFGANCLTCHLSAEPRPGPEYARLTGCAACHTPTANTDLSQPLHRLTTAIPYTQCNTCHNRGNYSLRDVQFYPRTDAAADRLSDYYQPIAQFTRCEWILECVDCHTNGEAMGDGDLHSNQKEIQHVRCRTCHGTLQTPPLTRTLSDPDDPAFRLARLNPVLNLQLGDTIVVSERGEPLWNVRQQPDGALVLTGKLSGQALRVPLAAGSACPQKADEQESRYCHACHAVQR